MDKNKQIKLTLISGVLFAVILASAFIFSQESKISDSQEVVLEEIEASQTADNFSYQGREGIDALTLLQEKTKVELATSGLVISINGRKAQDAEREFWSFYVNGEIAQVGPADYITKDADKIEWKIETY